VDLKNVKEFFFEITALVVPGALILVAALAFFTEPRRFPEEMFFTASVAHNGAPNPSLTSIAVFLAAAFSCGHVVQHVASITMRRLNARNPQCHDDLLAVFSHADVKEHLLPGLRDLPRTPTDYFMMAYPAAAPRTKRDTFIAVHNFCIGMAVSLASVAALTFGSFLLSPARSRFWASAFTFTVALPSAALLMCRGAEFLRMADAIVVNSFLGLLGEERRRERDRPDPDQ
jgi:hypothetical protein